MQTIGKISLALFALCGFVQPVEGADHLQDPQLYTKGCTVKSSRFDRWVKKSVHRLNDNSYLVETSAGPIQYGWHGDGPVILSIHGGLGGWDQGFVIADHLIKDDFSVLAVSRPGYLGTPLPTPSVEFTPAQQADLIAALLDTLGIPQVIALGFSAGGPVAFELAKRYPTRVTALVLESIGLEPQDTIAYDIFAGIVSQSKLTDFVSNMLYKSARLDLFSVAKFVLAQDTNLTDSALANRVRYVTTHSCQYKLLKKLISSSIPVSPRLAGVQNDLLGVGYWNGPNFDPVGFNVPTLIVESVNDTKGSYPTAVSVNAQIAGSQLITVQDSGHFIWFGTSVREWQKQVGEFIKAHKPQGSFKPDGA